MSNYTSKSQFNSFNIDKKLDKRFIKSFVQRNVTSFTLNVEISDQKLVIPYETFLIRCLYLINEKIYTNVTEPIWSSMTKIAILKNHIKRAIGRSPEFFNQEFIENVEYLANLRQYYQNTLISNPNAKRNLFKKEIDALSFMVKTISSLRLYQDTSMMWAVASWLGHAKYFCQISSSEFCDELSLNIDFCFLELLKNLVRLTHKKMDQNSYQYIGAFMKIGLVMSPKNKNYNNLLDDINYKFLMKLMRLKCSDACVFFNKIYTAALFNLKTNFSNEQIEEVEEIIKLEAKEFSKQTGGYSFYKNRSQDRYLSHQINSFEEMPDLHGTAMILWAEHIYSKGLFRETIYQDIHNVHSN